MQSENPLPCGECKYAGFNGLVWSCRHPEHPEPINGPLMLRIFGAGGRCSELVDVYKKPQPGREPDWSQPVRFEEVNHG